MLKALVKSIYQFIYSEMLLKDNFKLLLILTMLGDSTKRITVKKQKRQGVDPPLDKVSCNLPEVKRRN